MMKSEFERIAKRTVTDEQYKHIEPLYMSSNMDKYDFVNSIKGLLKSIPEKHDRKILIMAYHNKDGSMKTPNGCWYLTVKVELIDVNIARGRVSVKVIPNSFELKPGYDITDWDHRLIIEH